MLTKRGITLCILSLLLGIYLVIALTASQGMAAEAPCGGVRITVSQNQMSQFVTPDDIDIELDGITAKADTLSAADFNLRDLEGKLSSLSIIEKANCHRLANDIIAIDIVPMIPVARVFDSTGSYYINKAGKHLLASSRYQIDVPVIITELDSLPDTEAAISLIEQINANNVWAQLVSELKIARNGDFLIVPALNGHIVNIGDGSGLDDKMKRLFAFYNQVLSVKGWNYYDTISVKFARQVVGKVAPGKLRHNEFDASDLEFEEGDIDIDVINSRDSVTVREIKPKII
ncbi:MAG: cell division protein FtsQ/DivIB [Muribaculaceae bacterium]|nr:cell division protein FtsQ/DivIB [Muribaculaceae bacterium]